MMQTVLWVNMILKDSTNLASLTLKALTAAHWMFSMIDPPQARPPTWVPMTGF